MLEDAHASAGARRRVRLNNEALRRHGGLTRVDVVDPADATLRDRLVGAAQ